MLFVGFIRLPDFLFPWGVECFMSSLPGRFIRSVAVWQWYMLDAGEISDWSREGIKCVGVVWFWVRFFSDFY